MARRSGRDFLFKAPTRSSALANNPLATHNLPAVHAAIQHTVVGTANICLAVCAGNDARACGCSAGQAIVVASNLDRLVRIAGSFEKRPGVEERVSADVAAERSRPEFMDFWENEEGGWLQTELAGRTEEGQSGGAATEQWAPILGCSADKVWAELQSLLKQGAPQSSGEQGQHSNPGTRRTLACDGASEEPGSPSDAHKEPAPTVAPIVTSKHLPSLTPLTASQPASLVLPSEAVLIEKLGGLGTGEGVGGQPVVGAHAQGGTDWTAADSVFYPGDETDWAMIEEGEVGRGQKRMWDGAGLDGSSEERAQKKRGSDGREGAGEEGKERRSVTELQRELTQTQRLLHETEAALKEAKARAEVLEKALGDKEVAVEEASARAELFERAFHEQRGIVRKAELAAAQARETAVGRAKETAEVRSLSGTGVGRSVQVSAPVTRGQPVGGVEAAADVASSRVRPGSKPAVDNVREARAEPVTVARRPAGEAAVGGTGGGHTPWVEHQGGAQRTRRTEAGVAEGRGGGATQGGRHAWIPRGDRRGQGNKR